MIKIQKLDMNDIIAICRIIGLEEINRFMKENHISSRMVTGKTMLGYSQKGAAPFPMAFAVMYDLSRNDKRVIEYLEAKILNLINGIEKTIKESFESVPKAFFTLTSEINSRFKGDEALFCKVVEAASTKDYLSRIKMNWDITSEGNDINIVNTGIKIIKDTLPPVSNMEYDDFENLVGVLGIETARKIVPGMWLKGSDASQICDYLYKNKYNDKIRNFLIKTTHEVLLSMYEKYTLYRNQYNNEIKAAIQTLYESPFRTNLDFYIKITGQHFSKNYTNTLKETLLLPFINFNANESEKSEEIAELNKRIQNLGDVIRLRNAESEKRYSEYEAQIAELERSKKYAEDVLIANDVEMTRLLEINKEYEEKATVNNETSMLSSEKETLLTEIKHLEERKNELANDIKQVEEQHTQLIAKKFQLQNELDDEIKRFSDDFAHSTAIAAIIQQLNRTSKANRSDKSVLIEIPKCIESNITCENELLLVTDILADNLFSTGIQRNNDELAKILLSTIIGKGSFIIYGSNHDNIADAVSMTLFAEYAAHVVFPTDISDIPYFINEINGIQRSVVYIENALDSFSDRLCNSLTRHCKDKIFVFAVNDSDSIRSIKGSLAFEKCLYLNTELFTDYLAKPDFKANKCNLSLYQENDDVFNTIIGNDYVKQLAKIIDVSPFVYRFWIRIAANYGNKYNTKFSKNIVMELIASIMIRDNLCGGTIDELHDYINQNYDYKLEQLDKIFVEDTENGDDE